MFYVENPIQSDGGSVRPAMPASSVYKNESAQELRLIREAVVEIKTMLMKVKFDLKEDEPPAPCSFFDIRARLASSSLVKFFSGVDLSSDDVDTTVNTFTLVNALLLTIPFGLISGLNFSYWDALQTILLTCAAENPGFDGNGYFQTFYG